MTPARCESLSARVLTALEGKPFCSGQSRITCWVSIISLSREEECWLCIPREGDCAMVQLLFSCHRVFRQRDVFIWLKQVIIAHRSSFIGAWILFDNQLWRDASMNGRSASVQQEEPLLSNARMTKIPYAVQAFRLRDTFLTGLNNLWFCLPLLVRNIGLVG